jgi:hypothetical protein
MTGGAAPGGLLGFLTQYGQIIAFFAQLLYWLVLAAVSVYAVLLFKRYVDALTGGKAPAAPAEKKSVSVEDFTD